MRVSAGRSSVQVMGNGEPPSSESGFALITVIWGVGLVSLLMLAFTLNVRTQTRLASNAMISAAVEAASDAGVNIAVLDLVATAKLLPETRRFPHDGRRISCRMSADITATISVQDEEGKVDVNTATEPLLRALIMGLGASAFDASKYVDALIDFRDQDSLRRLNGAEADDYRAADLSWGPQDDAFRSGDELYRVFGFPPDLVKQMLPLVTVFSNRAGFDPRIAPRALLETVEDYRSAGSNPIPSSFAITSSRRMFAIRVDAVHRYASIFVREATVELGAGAEGYRFRAWKRGILPRAGSRELLFSDVALSPC
jgi:general secretion pathway protein K